MKRTIIEEKDIFDINIADVRSILNLDLRLFKSIPDDLILLAFIPKNLPPNTQFTDASLTKIRELKRDYNMTDNGLIEFYGDTLLSYIILREMQKFPQVNDPSLANRIKEKIGKNANLECLLRNKSICQKYNLLPNEIDERGINKPCANIFESLIGVLDYWFSKNGNNSIDLITRWLEINFHLNAQIDEVIKHSNIDKPCRNETSKRFLIPRDSESKKYVENIRNNVVGKPGWEELRKTAWPIALNMGFELGVFGQDNKEYIINRSVPYFEELKNQTLPRIKIIFKIIAPDIKFDTKEEYVKYIDNILNGNIDYDKALPISLNLIKSNDRRIYLPDNIKYPGDVIEYFLRNS
jgi:hypothetical protein